MSRTHTAFTLWGKIQRKWVWELPRYSQFNLKDFILRYFIRSDMQLWLLHLSSCETQISMKPKIYQISWNTRAEIMTRWSLLNLAKVNTPFSLLSQIDQVSPQQIHPFFREMAKYTEFIISTMKQYKHEVGSIHTAVQQRYTGNCSQLNRQHHHHLSWELMQFHGPRIKIKQKTHRITWLNPSKILQLHLSCCFRLNSQSWALQREEKESQQQPGD